MISHFRLARPVSDLVRTDAMYRAGLGLIRLGYFKDHEGFDGIMLGMPGGDYHFEFTYCRFHPVIPAPTPEDLLVFYIPDPKAWEQRCGALLGAGFVEVNSMNPYWARDGRTFRDADGYRLVIQCASWIDNPEV
ncbi:MAG: VOC family protein [Nitrosomonas sp.]|nr:VOC family protein [Nitrosomonas sp.]